MVSLAFGWWWRPLICWFGGGSPPPPPPPPPVPRDLEADEGVAAERARIRRRRGRAATILASPLGQPVPGTGADLGNIGLVPAVTAPSGGRRVLG